MSWLRAVLVRLGWRGGLDRLKREIDDELRFHIEMKVASNLRAGMNEADARSDAQRRFGDVENINSQGALILAGAPANPLRGGVFFAIYQDVRLAMRHIRRSPGYAISSVGVLALGLADVKSGLGIFQSRGWPGILWQNKFSQGRNYPR